MSPRMLEELKSFFTNLIGNTTDTGGSAVTGSLTAKVNALLSGQTKQAQQETVQDILSKLNTSGAITVNAVKRVQRGRTKMSGSTYYYEIAISAVDINKSFVNIQGNCDNAGQISNYQHVVKGRLESSNKLILQTSYCASNLCIDWEVIEFY